MNPIATHPSLSKCTGNICQTMSFCSEAVIAFDINQMGAVSAIPELQDKVDSLLRDLRHDNSVSRELDTYVLVYFMSIVKSPILSSSPWTMFVCHETHVLSSGILPDIGNDVRRMLLFESSKDLVITILQYSMPFIKHNRLSFPPLSEVTYDDLHAPILITLGMLTGILHPHMKRPVWLLRVKLMTFMHTLLSRGNAMDLYIFCVEHVSIVRVAMIEYFVHFVCCNMAIEVKLLQETYGLTSPIEAIFSKFIAQIDGFEFASLQTEKLDAKIKHEAYISIERCTRVCKGKTKAVNTLACASKYSRTVTSDISHENGQKIDAYGHANMHTRSWLHL